MSPCINCVGISSCTFQTQPWIKQYCNCTIMYSCTLKNYLRKQQRQAAFSLLSDKFREFFTTATLQFSLAGQFRERTLVCKRGARATLQDYYFYAVLWIRINMMRIRIRGSASGIKDPDPALGERFLRVLFPLLGFPKFIFPFFFKGVIQSFCTFFFIYRYILNIFPLSTYKIPNQTIINVNATT